MRKETKIFAGLIILISLILAVRSYWDEALIVDEDPHIGAGYSYLVKQDMRLNPEHPPLAKDLAAIPLLFMHLNQDAFTTPSWTTDVNGQWEFGRKLIYDTGNDARAITHYARLPILIFFLLSAILICIWGSELFGETGGIIALVLFCFSPTVLAHTRFVTTDVAALTGILYATYFFIRYLKRPTRTTMLVASIVFGIALLTKFSTFLLVPFLGLLAVIYGATRSGMTFKKNFAQAIRTGCASVLVFAIGFVIVTWPVYLFHTWNYPPARQHNDTVQNLGSYGNRTFADAVVWMSDKPIIRAAGQYALGLLMVNQRASGGNTTYFLGEVSAKGWWYYFPVVYFLKEPLAWWILAAAALATAAYGLRRSHRTMSALSHWIRNHFDQSAMLLWLAIYWILSIKSNLNIGVRHLLPTFPFAILLVAGQIEYMKERLQHYNPRQLKIFAVAIALLMGWYVFESTNVFPYYLAYFNQVAGGPSGGYRYVVDSNIDWGQDLARLADYVKERNIPKIELDYFGWASQYYYLDGKFIWGNSTKYKNGQDFLARNQSNGWIAVSATFLQGSPEYQWLRVIKPTTVIGHSIFLWHLVR